MNPTAALMLSREFEQDRRRALEARRQHRSIDPQRADRQARQRRTSVWTMLLHMPLHMPRFGPAR